ncbi:hypothetical protein M0813_16658 [Anaeramoeba flamelloides]|uniref:Uncharacterized protein n=1 Tax=Anaeramoeba flamelloides TaxID=1746091 RepID=A0ABQ8YZI3_9EUKA|nr:hypothetical protein M0813_16658 [Anaeramoeba flamelloides]
MSELKPSTKTKKEFQEELEQLKQSHLDAEKKLDLEIKKLDEKINSRKFGIETSKTLQKQIQTTIDKLRSEQKEKTLKRIEKQKELGKVDQNLVLLAQKQEKQDQIKLGVEKQISEIENSFVELELSKKKTKSQTGLLENELKLKMQIIESCEDFTSQDFTKSSLLNVESKKNQLSSKENQKPSFIQQMMKQATKNF